MARGDIGNEIASTADSGTLVYQPASGTEVILKTWGHHTHASVYLYYYDGTNTSIITRGGYTENGSMISVPVNNAHYIQIHNSTGSTVSLAYGGYVTKE